MTIGGAPPDLTPDPSAGPERLPLYRVFAALREQLDLALGVDEYLLLLRGLRVALGWQGADDLKRLCCLLWAKSPEEAEAVKRTFDWVLQELASGASGADGAAERTGDAASAGGTTESEGSQLGGPVPIAGITPVHYVQAVRRTIGESRPITRTAYHLRTDYFPVTQRQMKQSWRHLRRPVREGPPQELDVDATTARIGREGLYLGPVLLPRRVNRAQLLLLMDQGGSMVPFHNLTRQLLQSARTGGQLRQTTVYYFHDYPTTYIYTDPARIDARRTIDIIETLDERIGVLIVGDAGAARGNYDAGRIEGTKRFLVDLQRAVRRIAWLNPMPLTRWAGSSAAPVAAAVPMFEMSRRGLDMAIATLQGRHVTREIPC